ncbi:MAG: asparagine synthase (glutamine-hydrolyzing) [Helicobacteraceae bacterium]|nr:asparagine synthase (glutamine-hydrolyzing) [Helicobacteraceae bacterium]
MCGILGQLSSTKVDQKEFLKNLLMLQHRGPDDHGTYFDESIALGQTRLSIIDLSQDGHQPMFSNCENYIIIYNGEVYNFEDIKKDLVQKDYQFHSNTDTEVILNGYIEYKENIVDKLNGMFAFSIYNKSTKELFLARDRSGMKPLYYFQDTQNFIYSSELKTLKEYSKNINFDAKILFLLLGYVPEPLTIYENLSMFPSGHYGYYNNNTLTLTKYANYKYEPKIIKPYNEIVSDVSQLFESAIKRHMISDAPIGTFLSGGLDSSIITAVASKYKEELQTLSLVFEEKSLSEEYYQDLVVNKYKTKHTKYLIDEELFLSSIDEFFEAMEQPTIDGLNTYLVSKAAKESGLTTVLSGVGGDEIFYGYPSFKDSKTLNFLSKIPYSIMKIFEYSNKYKKLELLQAEKELAYYLPKRALFSPTEISEILNINKSKVYRLIVKLYKTYNLSNIKQIEDKISLYELNMYMKNQLLRDSDLFGMAHSLEIRVPFLDKDLVDYVLKVEPKEKFGVYNKQLLADISKSILPKEIYNRKKMGFVLPFENWFRKNIDRFDVDNITSTKFSNREITWSRFLAVLIIKRNFNEKL